MSEYLLTNFERAPVGIPNNISFFKPSGRFA